MEPSCIEYLSQYLKRNNTSRLSSGLSRLDASTAFSRTRTLPRDWLPSSSTPTITRAKSSVKSKNFIRRQRLTKHTPISDGDDRRLMAKRFHPRFASRLSFRLNRVSAYLFSPPFGIFIKTVNRYSGLALC